MTPHRRFAIDHHASIGVTASAASTTGSPLCCWPLTVAAAGGRRLKSTSFMTCIVQTDSGAPHRQGNARVQFGTVWVLPSCCSGDTCVVTIPCGLTTQEWCCCCPHLAGDALDLFHGKAAGVTRQLGQLLVVLALLLKGRGEASHPPCVRQLSIRRLQLLRCCASCVRSF
jgi:hypothetical protein